MHLNGLAVVIWTYFIGWKFIGGILIGKIMPNHLIIAKLIGSVIGFISGAIVSIAVFHS